MTILSAYLFQVRPPTDQTSRQCLAAIRDKVVTWGQLAGRKLGADGLQFSFDGLRVATDGGHVVSSDHASCPTHQLATLHWECPNINPIRLQVANVAGGRRTNVPLPQDSDVPEFAWHLDCTLACDERTVEVSLILRAVPAVFALWPLKFTVSRAALGGPFLDLARDLLCDWSCWIEGQPIPRTPWLLEAGRVATFVEEVLLRRERLLPVVMLGPGPRLLSNLSRPAAEKVLEQVQVPLLGLALVAGLRDDAAAARLTELIGEGLSCSKEGMQIYWPNMTRDSPLAAQLLFQTRGDPVSLVRPIYERLAGLRGALLEEGPLTRAAAAAIAQGQRQERHEIRKTEKRLAAAEAARQELLLERDAARQRVLSLQREVAEARGRLFAAEKAAGAEPNPADRAAWDELAANWEQAVEDNQRLRERLQAAEQRIEALADDVRLAHENLIWAWKSQHDPAPESAEPPEPAAGPADDGIDTVTAALQAAAAEYPHVLCVWEDAVRSAADSRFASPVQVLRALRAIGEVARLYFEAQAGGPALGPVDRALSARVPFKYSGFESATTLRLFGNERVFHDGQRSLQMQRHLTLGGGQTNHCLQIYFEFDDASNRVLIGYCGRHLPFCRQRS